MSIEVAVTTIGVGTVIIALWDELTAGLLSPITCFSGQFIGQAYFTRKEPHICNCTREWINASGKLRLLNQFFCDGCKAPILVTDHNTGTILACAEGHPKIQYFVTYDHLNPAEHRRITSSGAEAFEEHARKGLYPIMGPMGKPEIFARPSRHHMRQ